MHEYAKPPARVGSGATSRGAVEPTRDDDLVVVSNRQPYRHTYESGALTVDRPTGGLTAGLDPAMQRIGGTWIAWGDGEGDREATDDDGVVRVPPDDPSYLLKRIWLTDEEVGGYYHGFANQVLWPACHGTLGNVRCDPGFFERYRVVNDRFAAAAVELAGSRSIVWLQDYHFALAPRTIRPSLPAGAFLMQFWHIPWPDPDTFRATPHDDELLRGLLGNDLLCFHVPRYRRNFLRYVDAAVDGARVDWESNTVHHSGGVTRVEVHPMGVQADRIQRRARAATDDVWETFAREHDVEEARRFVLGVDRLDYSKGIVERLRALEHLWEARPEWREAFTYVEIASESRSAIPAYRELQTDVTEAVERINRKFGTDAWRPIVHTTEWIDQETLAGLYRHADAAIVSPIRDGMNLVAQEYVAAQVDGDGVLVLSEQAGVHDVDVVGEHAVSVAPMDTAGFADRIEAALTMAPIERRRRMAALRQWMVEHDLSSWIDGLLRNVTELRRSGPPVSRPGRGVPNPSR